MSGERVSLQRCITCGTQFHCGRDDPAGCWCAALPALDPGRYDAAGACLCEACLRRALEGQATAAAVPPLP